MNFKHRKGTSDWGVIQNTYLNNDYRLPNKFPVRAIVIDVGAHIGTFAVACAERGASKVISFEPDLENFYYLEENTGQYRNIVLCHHNAVWSRSTRMMTANGYPVEPSGEVNCGGFSLVTHEPVEDTRDISALAIDTILDNFDEVHTLKLDCESSEWPILYASKQLYKVQNIIGEFHEPPAGMDYIDDFFHPFHEYNIEYLVEYLKDQSFQTEWYRHGKSNLGMFFARQT